MLETLNHFFADTLGVIWRAAFGTLDPWTRQEIRYRAKRGY